jgi:hypothetical protein
MQVVVFRAGQTCAPLGPIDRVGVGGIDVVCSLCEGEERMTQ